MQWNTEALELLGRVPVFVRPLVKRKAEEFALEHGRNDMTAETFQAARAGLMGAAGRPGSPDPSPGSIPYGLVAQVAKDVESRGTTEGSSWRLRVCGGAFGCPRAQVDVAALRDAIAEVLAERDKDAGDAPVLTHHKVSVAVAGCANSCSETPARDFGVIGRGRPAAVAGRCTHCRSCERACKEGAVVVGPDGPEFDEQRCIDCADCAMACRAEAICLTPGIRITAGGRLGRHPRLAEPLCTCEASPEKVAETLRKSLTWLAEAGQPRLSGAIEVNGIGALKRYLDSEK